MALSIVRVIEGVRTFETPMEILVLNWKFRIEQPETAVEVVYRGRTQEWKMAVTFAPAVVADGDPEVASPDSN